MQFQVPQFISVEDKIIGPLTIKQGVYLAGGAALSFIVLRFLPLFIGLLACTPIIALSLALAFYKVNNKPFINIMESAVKYFFNEKLYLWRKVDKKVVKNGQSDSITGIDQSLLYVPKLADSKLKDLTWSLDVTDTLNPVTKK
jgi:hypothetical protein